ncbi:MAG TPA: ComF family protein [Luteimonas sp.]|nr:ComF family protein [Luteimonas sp.]
MPEPVNRFALPDVDGAWRRRLGALWPARCLACGEAGAPGRDLCAACLAALPWNRHACASCAIPLPGACAEAGPPQACGECLLAPPPLRAAHAAFVYAAPLDRLLPRFKFHHDLAAGRLLAQLMAGGLADAQRPQALLPVPLHRARLRARGYDQALELARPLARALRLPLLPGALRRVRPTAPQSELDAVHRARNLRGAFAVAPGAALPAHVALVDDVMTTGATLHAAARALRRAGVARVDAWVCARVP